ncbi:alpha/beta hydrolase fold domain-containing protein [Kribbella swartbergensis]
MRLELPAYDLDSPWPASEDQLRGSPALITAAEADALRDGAEAYAMKLRSAGVPVG